MKTERETSSTAPGDRTFWPGVTIGTREQDGSSRLCTLGTRVIAERNWLPEERRERKEEREKRKRKRK